MIAIINVKPAKSDDRPSTYELRINSKLVVTFKHERVAGLAECLRAAADAVESKKHEDMLRLVELGAAGQKSISLA